MDIRPPEHQETVGFPNNWEQAEEFISSTPYTPLVSLSADPYAYSRNSDFSYFPLHSLPMLCTSKEGSIRAQQLLGELNHKQISEVILVFSPSLCALIQDPYGNYTIQSLFQSCSAEQRVALLESLEPELVFLAQHTKGTHGLQTLVTLCSTVEEELIYKRVFKGKVLELAMDVSAAHVIQKLLTTVKNRYVLVGELLGHAHRLATDKTGLCVIKAVLNDPQIFDELIGNALELMQDPYGNYAMQILVELWMDEVSFLVICAIKGKVAQLCVQKYSSNVIEKCLKEENMRNFVMEELLHEGTLEVLLGSPYGCYVLRTAAKSADKGLKDKFRPILANVLRSFSYKNMKSRWDEILSFLQ